MKCPSCGYARQATDDAPQWQCPSCKVAYNKVKAKASAPVQMAVHPADGDQGKHMPVTGDAGANDLDEDDDVYEEREEKCWLAARGQKIVIYSIILNFVLRAAEQTQVFQDVVVAALFFCTAAFSLMGVVSICSGLDKTPNQKILYLVLSFFPLINIVLLVYLSVKTSRMLRESGWEVGLLGAKA